MEPGVTGFLVDTVEEAKLAIPHLLSLDRRSIRKRFEKRFSATRMANDYVRLYRRLMTSSKSVDPIVQDDFVRPLVSAKSLNDIS
jgi:glycosyltransferase involved in cell wall biosynthesis